MSSSVRAYGIPPYGNWQCFNTFSDHAGRQFWRALAFAH